MDLSPFFKFATDNKASDLHLVEGSVPMVRVDGELKKISDKTIREGELKDSMLKMLNDKDKERFNRKRDLDISMDFYEVKYRINLHYQEGKMGMAARRVASQIPTPEDIGLSEIMYNLTHLRDGLILVTGPAGVGKSTTLAVMLEIINQERAAHVITIEDPIEYTFTEKKSLIEQRQLGRDTYSFATALKYVLRQDPNVIMVGEMRDSDTAAAVLNAAKTGHLVLSTLHTSSASETIERIIDFYPSQFQHQIAHQLASLLRGVITQQLLPKKDGGVVAAREIMIVNSAIATLIRSMQIEQIDAFIQTSKDEGMISMNKSINNLARAGIITLDTANSRIRNTDKSSIYK